MSPFLGIEHPNALPLTPRQRQALRIIRRHIEDHGQSPTVREVMQALGGASPSVAQALLDRLEGKGFIYRYRNSGGRSSRNLRLTEKGAAADLSALPTAEPPDE